MEKQTNTASLNIKRTVAALAAIGVLGAGGAMVVHQNNAGANAAAVASAPVAAAVAPAAAGAPLVALPDFSQIAARNSPAVVNISVTGSTKVAYDPSAQAGNDDFGNDPFFEFFRRFQGPQGGQRGGRDVPTHGLGSGFIVSPDGIIMTNAHVVRDAREVTVKLNDRREFRAKVLGSDPKTDIAVLKIDASNLPVVPLGHSNDLKVGEWVLAIGSPYGFDSTVTAGVVSAKGRSLPDDSNVPFIQTDVAVNPGNSGGPLINMRGEVIGINSQIATLSGAYNGISFAVPIDEAMRVGEQLKKTGKVVRGRIGVQIGEVSKDVAQSLGLPNAKGAQVSMVEEGGPADKAGIKPGDIILKFNGAQIERSSDLPRLVGGAAVNGKSTVTVWRKGAQQDIPVTVVELEAEKTAKKGAREPEAQAVNALGLKVSDVPAAKKQELKIDGGVQVDDADGVAALAGLQPGDVILQLNNVAVKDAKQFNALVAKLDPKKSAAVLVRRGDVAQFVSLRPSAK